MNPALDFAVAPPQSLPRERKMEPWLVSPVNRVYVGSEAVPEDAGQKLAAYVTQRSWVWPERSIYFFCDLHADAQAFVRSLFASAGVEKCGAGDLDFRLTEQGKKGLFIIGGDCFDKGPHNLVLLRALKRLVDLGAEVEILAGNHDVRTLIGIQYAGAKDVQHAHLFARMGKKTVPLFKEIWDDYGDELSVDRSFSEPELRALLFPDASWYERFPSVAKDHMPEAKLQKELKRIAEKVAQMEETCAGLGMDLHMVYAALQKCRELFLEAGGEFHWFFDRMTIAVRHGSFLFIHAGVDDTILETLLAQDNAELRCWFQDELAGDLFALYHGNVGNCFRTKYREYDKALSEWGVARLHESGIHAIVHGHLNLTEGQRLVYRQGMLNMECDTTLDRNTRDKEHLKGDGWAVTLFRPDGRCLGMSSDYPMVKTFAPDLG